MGSKNKTTIFVNTSFDGVHLYQNAPNEVGYLSSAHRHKFGVRVEIEVFHDDREIEFFILKDKIDRWLHRNMQTNNHVWYMGGLSCEQVAKALIEELGQLKMLHGKRSVRVTIDEDGQNGATVKTKLHTNSDTGGHKEPCCDDDEDDDEYSEEEYKCDKINGCHPDVCNNDDEEYGEDCCSVPKKCREYWTTGNDTKERKDDIDYDKLYDVVNCYQEDSYSQIHNHTNNQEEVMHWSVGLGEEAGEVLGVVKHKYYGGQYAVEDLIEELGDVLWYVAALCTANDVRLSDVMKYNLVKLQFRYPDEEFDYERSMARAELKKDFRKNSSERNAIMKDVIKKIEAETEMRQHT